MGQKNAMIYYAGKIGFKIERVFETRTPTTMLRVRQLVRGTYNPAFRSTKIMYAGREGKCYK